MVLVVKNLPTNVGDARDTGSIPRLGRSPGVGNGKSLFWVLVSIYVCRAYASVSEKKKSHWLSQKALQGNFFPRPESLFGRNSFQKFHSLDPEVFLHLEHTLMKIHKPMVLSMYNRVNNYTSEKFHKHCSMENSTEMENKTVAQNAWEAPNPVSFFWKLAVYKNLLNNLDGLPQWPSSKESTCNAGVSGDASSIPGSGRPPGKGNGNPLQYSCLNPMARGDWRAISPWNHKELDTTEAT